MTHQALARKQNTFQKYKQHTAQKKRIEKFAPSGTEVDLLRPWGTEMNAGVF